MPAVRRSGVSLLRFRTEAGSGCKKSGGRRSVAGGVAGRSAVGRCAGGRDRWIGGRATDRAVGRSRRESVDRHPGPNGTSSGPPARTTLYRPNEGVGTTVTSERSATLFTGAAYDRHAGPTLRFTGSAETCTAPPHWDSGALPHAPAPATPRPPFRARTHHTNRPNPRRRVLAITAFAAFEPGSFGGSPVCRRRPLGQRAWPNCRTSDFGPARPHNRA